MARPAALALLVLLAACAPAAAAPQRCSQVHPAKDLAPASHVKLFARSDGALAGCVMPRGPVRKLATSVRRTNGYEAWVVRQVVGQAVVFDTSQRDGSGGIDETHVAHLGTGRRYATSEACRDFGAGYCGPTAQVVTAAAYALPDGRAVALLFAPGSVSVVAFTATGGRRVLDLADPGEIPAATLGLVDDVAYWSNSGTPRSAVLP